MQIMSKHQNRPVDMSVPAEKRGRKRKQSRIVATPPAQLAHATSPRAQRQARRGEQWLTREENARFAEAGKVLLLDAEGFAVHVRQRIAEEAEETPVSGRTILDVPGGAEALAVVYEAAEIAEPDEDG